MRGDIMNKLMKWVAMLAFLSLGIRAALAQDSVTALKPHTDEGYGIQSVIPAGWMQVGGGVYKRGKTATDVAVIVQQSVPVSADQLLTAMLPQLALKEVPKSVGTRQAALDWTLYRVDVKTASVSLTIDLALAEQDGKTYLVLLQTAPEDYQELHSAVFLPTLDAFAPLAETTPEGPLPYTAEDVTFSHDDITLAGTLTLPEGDGPHPAIVLVSGSGPQDRDESLGLGIAIKPFRLIADYLTRRGIAVLRYDDRGTAKSTGDFATASTKDFADDAEAAINYLLTRKEIDPQQIGLLGHSEGGEVAAMLAARNKNLAFVVSMSGPAVSGEDVFYAQSERTMKAEGATDSQVQAKIDYLKQAFPLALKGDKTGIEKLTYNFTLKQIQELPEDQRKALGDPNAYAQQVAQVAVQQMLHPSFAGLLTYNPADDWAKVTIPVLATFGGKDVQVPADQNAPAFEAAMKKAGNTDYKVVILPDANHLYQAAETGAFSEYAKLKPEFTPDFLPALGEWLLAHVKLAT
jgi:pimeloyl-ACP methyl ester carboxylesterase